MSAVAIRVEGISKKYRIAPASVRNYRTLQEDLLALPRRLLSAAGGNGARRDEFWALQDVSFEVNEGQALGIVGRNGAGKSTLLKILSRITDPTSGRAEIYGRVGSLLEIGTGFHAELTGRENIFLSGAVLGMRHHEIQRRFDEIVAFSEVEQFLNTPVKHFSSGMYMRLAFAVAAHLEPEILLVDEVLAVGDIAFQRKCLGKMQEVAQSGRTVLFVSHNLNAVEELCQSALLLEHGRVVRLDSDVRSVLKQYLFGEQSAGVVAEWHNSGAEFQYPAFTPRRFFIADAQGGCHPMPVSNDDEFYFQIEGDITQPDNTLTLGYAIYAEDGTLLYYSYLTDSAEQDWPPLDAGHCVLRSRVPARFLNEGSYRLELIAQVHNRSWLMQPGVNAPQVTLVIQGGLSDSPIWVAKRPGILGPVLDWARVS